MTLQKAALWTGGGLLIAGLIAAIALQHVSFQSRMGLGGPALTAFGLWVFREEYKDPGFVDNSFFGLCLCAIGIIATLVGVVYQLN